jgi:hypothetical protein
MYLQKSSRCQERVDQKLNKRIAVEGHIPRMRVDRMEETQIAFCLLLGKEEE